MLLFRLVGFASSRDCHLLSPRIPNKVGLGGEEARREVILSLKGETRPILDLETQLRTA